MNKRLQALLAEAQKHEENSLEYLKGMFAFHDACSEHWGNKIGKTQDDNKCTREWNKHNRFKDELWNMIQAYESKPMADVQSMAWVLVALTTAKQQLDKVGMETSLICDNMKYDVATMIDNIKSEMERVRETAKRDQA